MFIKKEHLIRHQEIWCDEAPPARGADVISHRQSRRPVGRCTPFSTVLIDLSLDEEQIFAAFKKEARQEIRRCEKDGVRHESWLHPDEETLDEYCLFYDEFAASKNLPLAPRGKLHEYAAGGRLMLTRAVHEDKVLLWHSFVMTGKRCRGLQSASHSRLVEDKSFRQMVGRSNRFCHWHDMLIARSLGFLEYDLGGWYAGSENAELVRVNKFKEEFGGKVVEEFDCVYPSTWKGVLYFLIKYRSVPGRLLGR